jgi:hypothetical protein
VYYWNEAIPLPDRQAGPKGGISMSAWILLVIISKRSLKIAFTEDFDNLNSKMLQFRSVLCT